MANEKYNLDTIGLYTVRTVNTIQNVYSTVQLKMATETMQTYCF